MNVPNGLRGSQRPGLLHLPDGSEAYVDDALYLLGEWGFSFDEAQRFVLASSLREMPDGRWAAKEVGIEEPRQNGKGEKIEGRECLGLFLFGERRLIHSAHEFATASEALDRMDDRIGQNPKLKKRVRTIKRSHGEEGVYLKDGRTLRYKTRTKGGGRGFSADLLILDEAMYIAEAFLGALMPVISARPNPQMWYTGSAVNQMTMENGIVFARLRQRALEHQPGRMAYFGWSAAYRDGKVIFETPADVPREVAADPETVAVANAALGSRIDVEHAVVTERQAMSHEQYCVERLGVGDWPKVSDDVTEGWEVISEGAWSDRLDPASAIVGTPVLSYDVTPDRSYSAIGAAGFREDGQRHVQVLEHGRGTAWLPGRLAELVEEFDAGPVKADLSGPAASVVPKLEALEVEVDALTAKDHAQASGAFFDGVDQGEVWHIGQDELNAAVKGAAKRKLGEAWAWGRVQSGVDISPLVVVTLANWGLDDEDTSFNVSDYRIGAL